MKIINPITGKSHPVKSKAGRQILKKYIQSYLNGGSSGIDVDDLECQICYQEFNTDRRTPMTSSCGHTICKECVDRLTTQECPLCRAPRIIWTKNFLKT